MTESPAEDGMVTKSVPDHWYEGTALWPSAADPAAHRGERPAKPDHGVAKPDELAAGQPDHGIAKPEEDGAGQTDEDSAGEPGDVPVAQPEAEEPAKRSWSRRLAWLRRRWVATPVFAVVFVGAGLLLFVAYLAQARTMPLHIDASSFSAPQMLQAWDMLHGNPLLRGWQVGDVSYYTTELPEYALVEWVRGLNGGVTDVAAALTYTLMVLLAALLAKGRATGRQGLVRMLVAAGIMVAPSLAAGTSVLLSGPDHTGTQVPLLLTWLVLDRARERWWAPVLVTVLLAWVQIADPLVLAEGVLPVALVAVVRMYRRRGLAGQWYDLSLAAGALVSVVAAKVALAMIGDAGGFSVRSLVVGFASSGNLTNQFWSKVGNVLALFGADFLGLPSGQAASFALIHVVSLVLVAWAVAVGVRRFFDGELIVQVLAAAFVVLLVSYIVGDRPDPNEMVGLLPIGAVLAGRVLADRLIRARLVPALAVALACSCAILAHSAAFGPSSNDSAPTASWFEAHHLSNGLAGYAQAETLTVLSGNRLHIWPTKVFDHMLVTTPWENDATWYDPRLHYANFVIMGQPGFCGDACESEAALSRIYGPPAVTYLVGQDEVLVWHANLLKDVPSFSWCQQGVWAWTATIPPSESSCK